MQSPKTIIKLSHLVSRSVNLAVSPSGKTLNVANIKQGNWIDSIVGFFSEKIGSFLRSINFSKIWGWIVAGFNYLWAFNWQATDEELNEQIKQSWLMVETRMFGLVGRAFGYLMCGAVPGAIVATFNAPLAAFLLKELGDEAVSDLLGELGGFFQLAGQAALQSMFLKAYQSIRSLIKRANKNPVIRRALNSVGVNNNVIDKWGEEKGKTWSFSQGLQNWIEGLNDERLQSNVEEFIDEFSDSCLESGYVLAEGLDKYLGLDGTSKGIFDLGQQKIVQFTPNSRVPGETFELRGTTAEIRKQMSEIVNSSQIIDNRDMGLLLPNNSDFDEIPITESNGIELTFEFINYTNPPYWTKDRRNKVVRSKLTVPNCDREKISWTNIKTILGDTATSATMGGDSRRNHIFMKGNVRCEANLSNGRKLVVYASDENEGENLLLRLARFTSFEIIYPINVRMHKGTNNRVGYNLTRVPTHQYLASVTVCNWDKLTKYQQQIGVLPSTVNRKSQTAKLKMHYGTKPSWWDKELNEALSNTVTN